MPEKEENKLPSPEERAKLPPDGGPEYNRLIHEKSPYLLQHARNPVDWYPWGPEAFDKAQKEDKPIFLSVGYSTCHWCHVMAHDSFESKELADVLNRHYVSIKVDREERPDVDEIYMNATQLMVNAGGWPNSVWLMPDARPWYAGTFFPREDAPGRPGLKTILLGLAEFWRNRREEVVKQADQLAQVLKRITQAKDIETTGEISRELVSNAIREMRKVFDERHGGFGDAPKFPPHSSLNLLFYQYLRTEDDFLLHMIDRTLTGMERGGIHDHIGGGFHRYSTDAQWLLPHFEKMLYDNTMLARAYAHGYLLTGNRDFREAATRTYEWIFREMSDSDGGFYSAIDADSEGVEGKFYVWSYDEILSILGEREGGLFCRVYNIKPEGNFREESSGRLMRRNVPHLTSSFQELAEREGMPEDELRSRLADARRKLLNVRANRVRPDLDEKILTACNGLMIGSLAFAGSRLKESSYTKAAERAARFALKTLRSEGRLLRTYRDGEAKLNAYLDDYAFLIDGLLDLFEATNHKVWLNEARELMETLIQQFYDEEDGGFYFTSKDHEQLLIRLRDPLDKATPSGNGVAARALVRLAHLTGEKRYLELAKKCFEAFRGVMERAPRGTESLLLALSMYLDIVPAEAVSEKTGETPDASARKEPVKADIYISKKAAAPGETVQVAVRLTVNKGWHINSNKPLQDELVPTSLELHDAASISLGDVVYPAGRKAAMGPEGEPVSIYEGTTWIVAPVKIDKRARPGKRELDVNVQTQACSEERCLAPERLALTFPLEVTTSGGEKQHQAIFEMIKPPAGKPRKRKI